jgi:hypothetical protein
LIDAVSDVRQPLSDPICENPIIISACAANERPSATPIAAVETASFVNFTTISSLSVVLLLKSHIVLQYDLKTLNHIVNPTYAPSRTAIDKPK